MHLFLRTLGLSLFLGLCPAVSAFGETIKYWGIIYETMGPDATVVSSEDKDIEYALISDKVFDADGNEHTVTAISANAFKDCKKLESFDLSPSVRTISSSAFAGCTSLKEVIIPRTVTTINDRAFYGCTGLKCFKIYSGITFWPYQAFAGCSSLEKVIFMGQNIPGLQLQDCFDKDTRDKATLYVPLGCKSAFESKEFWKFKNIIEIGNIVDGERYTQDFEVETKVKYTRNFKNTNWQALYVPFSIPVDTLAAHGLKVAELDRGQGAMGIDDNLKFTLLESGDNTIGNYPYLIKADEVGEVSFVLKERMLRVAESFCSLMLSTGAQDLTFMGTYEGVTGEEMFNNSYYAMSGGGLMRAADNTVSLKPQRWYVKLKHTGGVPVVNDASVFRITVNDMDEEETTTGIEDCPAAPSVSSAYYDMSGRRTSAPAQSGLFVHQGKIELIRK
jgi:hypothetical protein